MHEHIEQGELSLNADKVTIIVLDSVGIGELPDAKLFGDEGSNTLVHTARAVGGLFMPNMAELGLGNITEIKGLPRVEAPLAAYGKMAERSPGKDTTSGHWEICGLVLEKPFPTYPDGFPQEIISSLEKATGLRFLGNVSASGTEIIERLGREHLRTGYPIVYTSADSVFQVAAHEEVIPPDELYSICRTARKLLDGKHAVGRVIARPFRGEPGNFERTPRRRDFSLPPPQETLLDKIVAGGKQVTAIGKIEEIFAGRGITRSLHTRSNTDGVNKVLDCMRDCQKGLIFCNLVEFDSEYGHRNDPQGYARALEEFDRRVPELIRALGENDVLALTADHGCDPTTPSTDHSREYVPVLVTGPKIKEGIDLGIRETFADLGATVADLLKVGPLQVGESMLPLIS